MVSTLKRFWFIIIFIALLLFATVFWYLTMRQSNAKIPSRGVYVLEHIGGDKVTENG